MHRSQWFDCHKRYMVYQYSVCVCLCISEYFSCVHMLMWKSAITPWFEMMGDGTTAAVRFAHIPLPHRAQGHSKSSNVRFCFHFTVAIHTYLIGWQQPGHQTDGLSGVSGWIGVAIRPTVHRSLYNWYQIIECRMYIVDDIGRQWNVCHSFALSHMMCTTNTYAKQKPTIWTIYFWPLPFGCGAYAYIVRVGSSSHSINVNLLGCDWFVHLWHNWHCYLFRYPIITWYFVYLRVIQNQMKVTSDYDWCAHIDFHANSGILTNVLFS